MFKTEYNKRYTFIEEQEKLLVFWENLNEIRLLNEAAASEGGDRVEYGVTQFADMTVQEFKEKILMTATAPKIFEESRLLKLRENISDLPDNFDWRDHGAVTPVKDQGSVGTCWAFSATGNIEGQWFLAGNPLVGLSEEQIVDCDGSFDISTSHADCGVFGGWPYLAFDFIIRTGGLPTEQIYPYCVGTGKCFPCPAPGYNETLCGPPTDYCNPTTSPCRLGKVPITATIEEWKVLGTDEEIIKQQLTQVGPLSIALNASTLQFYKKGVLAPKHCNPVQLNHAVLLVGYGIDSNTNMQFWSVKNSWGAKWGEQGYFRIKRGVGMCGVNTQVATSVVSKQQEDMVEQVDLYQLSDKFRIAFSQKIQ